MRKDILIVDGYNIIFAWSDLKALSKESLEHARLELRHRLQNYGKYKGYVVILVFDGNQIAHASEAETISEDFVEVFTAAHETADAYIEKEVFKRKGTYRNIYVSTSDGDEQSQVLGFGGLRITAKELQSDLRQAKQEERRHYEGLRHGDMLSLQRNELGGLLDDSVVEALEKIRRGR